MTRVTGTAFGLLLLLTCACGSDAKDTTLAKRDFQPFQREVYPVLLRDCGFPACHGAKKRFFRVWGPGRARLPNAQGTTPAAFDLPTVDEISASYSLALSMIDTANPTRSALLRKPLAVAAGGAGHLGVDKRGRDLYRTKQDSGYAVLEHWVLSTPAAAPLPMPTTPAP